jgi:HAMP domain-containing protein
VRTYTSEHVNPLLQEELQTEEQFISASVPAFSARQAFENLRSRAEYSQFRYKEASTNPTQPLDRADEFEAQMLDVFHDDPSVQELSGFTMRDGIQVFYIIRPLRITSESCLACHSTPEVAPASLINTYGSENGFGWQLNEVIAAQTIYIPAQEVFDQAYQAVSVVMGIIVAIFAVVIIVTNAGLRRAVVRPAVQIARLAQMIGSDSLTHDAPEMEQVNSIARRHDEFGHTARIIQRMAQEIYAREQKLKDQILSLRIQIDTEKQEAQVHEITESDYFQNLQQRVHQIRKRASDTDSSTTPPNGEGASA